MNKKLLMVFGMIFLLGIMANVQAAAPSAANTVAYYKLQGTSGTVVDSVGTHNGTNHGATRGVTGIIDNGFQYSGSSQYTSIPNLGIGTGDFSVNLWCYQTASGTDKSPACFGSGGLDGLSYEKFMGINVQQFTVRSNGQSGTTYMNLGGSLNTWNMLTITKTGNSYSAYLNGVYKGSLSTSSSESFLDIGNTNLGLLYWKDNNGNNYEYYTGKIDEVGIFNYTLNSSEISYLYNLGSPGALQQYPFSGVSLTYPTNNSAINTTSTNLNATISSSTGSVDNVTLYFNGTTQTNTSGLVGDYSFPVSGLTNGQTYSWKVGACNPYGCTNSSTYQFTVDTESPTINITSPTGTFDYLYQNYNMTLNFTASDNHALDSVWYSYNGTNTTVSVTNGTLKTVYFPYQAGQNSLTVYSNDTAGNLASNTKTWTPKVVQTAISYPTTAITTSIQDYSLHFDSSMVTSAELIFNNVTDNSILTFNSNYLASNSITMPGVTTPTNFSFYYKIYFSDGNSVVSPNYYTYVLPFSIDNCATNTYHIINYQFKDESSLLNLTSPNTFNLSSQIFFYGSGKLQNLFYNYSISANNIDSLSLCSSQNLTNQNFYVGLRNTYIGSNASTGYKLTEYANIQNQSLASLPKAINMDLYALNSNDNPQFFTINYKNIYFQPQSGILLSIERYYPSLNGGTYITVQSPITDSFGNAPAQLITENQRYSIVLSKNGNILATYPDYYAICQNPLINTCSIQLNEISQTNPIYNFSSGISYYTSSTNTSFTTTFSTPSGTPSLFTLTGYYSNGTQICSSSITTSSGQLTCNFPEATNLQQYTFIFTKGGDVLFNQQLNSGQTFGNILGGTAPVIGFLIVLLFGMMFISSPILGILGTILGLIVLSIMTITKGGLLFGASTGFIFLALSGIILIWKISKSPYGR